MMYWSVDHRMYSVKLLLVAVVIFVAHATNDNDDGNLHLRNHVTGGYYQTARGEEFHQIIMQQLAGIKSTLTKFGCCSAVFHGRFGSGKSSLIERLLTWKGYSISSFQMTSDPNAMVGHTKECIGYNLNLGHDCDMYVIDTPGFGEMTEAAKETVLECATKVPEVLQIANHLVGIYMVVCSERLSLRNLPSTLNLLKLIYGESAAKRTRFIINKAESLVKEEAKGIEDKITGVFQECFQCKPEKFLYTVAKHAGADGCIGQLIDDLSNLDESRLIQLDRDGDAILLNLHSIVLNIEDKKKHKKDLEGVREKLISDRSDLSDQISAKIERRHKFLQEKEAVNRTLQGIQFIRSRLTEELDQLPFKDLSGCDGVEGSTTETVQSAALQFLENSISTNLLSVRAYIDQIASSFKRMHGSDLFTPPTMQDEQVAALYMVEKFTAVMAANQKYLHKSHQASVAGIQESLHSQKLSELDERIVENDTDNLKTQEISLQKEIEEKDAAITKVLMELNLLEKEKDDILNLAS